MTTKKYYIRTLRLKIYPFGEDKKLMGDRMYQISNDAWRAANVVINGQYFNDIFVRNSYARKKIDAKTDKAGVMLVEEEFKNFFGTKRQATTERDMKSKFPNIPPCVTNSLNQTVVACYRSDKSDMMMGKRSLRSYKQGMPFLTTKTSVEFFEDGDKHAIKWKLNRKEHLYFYIFYGRDKGKYKDTMNRVINEDLEYASPQFQIKKGAFYLLLPVKDVQETVSLKSDLSVGVDLGVSVPAYVALSKGKAHKAIGSIDDFLRVRLQMQRRRKKLQVGMMNTAGGHGCKKKLAAGKILSDKERNFAKTYNHMISRRVVDFAIKHKAGTIKLESLKGFGRGGDEAKEEEQKFILRNWSFFELQTMITYKAKRAGIDVIMIDPYHTSQICSSCEHFESGQRLGREFICKSCGSKLNADHNAAINISQSTTLPSQ